MGAAELLFRLAARGFRVDLAVGNRLQVSPASALTDDDRTLIRMHRVELLTLVSIGALDPDRCCWPHSEAMNTAEMDIFTLRLQRFVGLGLEEKTAEVLADQLVQRDRRGDHLHMCVECKWFRPWRCGNPRAAGRDCDDIEAGLAVVLHRCKGFMP